MALMDELGWEAGIRTPITASRAPCPTVERPPSIRPRKKARAGTTDCTKKKRPRANFARGPLEMRDVEATGRLANQFALIVAAGALGHVRRTQIGHAAALLVAFLAPPMARHAAFAAGLARFFAGPLMGRALLVRCFAALAGNLALLGAVHRRESAILFSHTDLLPQSRSAPQPYVSWR